MWPFTGSSSKKISSNRLDSLLRSISVLDSSERQYVKGLFQQYRSGGISKFEIERAVREMKLNTSDPIDRSEAEAVRDKLLSFLK